MIATTESAEPNGTMARGLLLPSMTWATSPAVVVEQEKQRLVAARVRLAALVAGGAALDSSATWYLMAECSLAQLDRDLDDLFRWLEEEAPGCPGA